MGVTTDALPPAAYSGLKSGCCSGGTGLPLRRRRLVGHRSGLSSEASRSKAVPCRKAKGVTGVGSNLSGGCGGGVDSGWARTGLS